MHRGGRVQQGVTGNTARGTGLNQPGNLHLSRLSVSEPINVLSLRLDSFVCLACYIQNHFEILHVSVCE